MTVSSSATDVHNEIGARLRMAREARGRSIRQLADRSGIARSTISRWETGASRPKRSEIEYVLTALGYTPADLLGFWQSIPMSAYEPQHTPRRRLFRATRIRNGFSLGTAADRVGVSKATLSRWESGDRWPGREKLAEAARALGASDREVAAILSEGPILSELDLSPGGIQGQIRLLRDSIPVGASAVRDIEFIGLDARIAGREGPDGRRLRLELRTAYVEWLGWWYRDAEAGALAAKLLPGLQKDPHSSVWGRILRAWANYTTEFRHDPEAAMDLLTEASRHLKGAPSEGFVLRELAGLMANLGETAKSREMVKRARESSGGEEGEDVHLYCCSMIEAATWSSDGRHDRAIDSLPEIAVLDPYLRKASAIGRADVYRQAGMQEQAREQLEAAVADALSKGLDHFARGLARRLLTVS